MPGRGGTCPDRSRAATSHAQLLDHLHRRDRREVELDDALRLAAVGQRAARRHADVRSEVLVQAVIAKLGELGATRVAQLEGIEENVVFPLPKGLAVEIDCIAVA